MQDLNSISKVLYSNANKEQYPYIASFLLIVSQLVEGEITLNEAEMSIRKSMQMQNIVHLLQGRSYKTQDSVVSFGESNQFADINLSDIAGHDLNKHYVFNFSFTKNSAGVTDSPYDRSLDCEYLIQVGALHFINELTRFTWRYEGWPAPIERGFVHDNSDDLIGEGSPDHWLGIDLVLKPEYQNVHPGPYFFVSIVGEDRIILYITKISENTSLFVEKFMQRCHILWSVRAIII